MSLLLLLRGTSVVSDSNAFALSAIGGMYGASSALAALAGVGLPLMAQPAWCGDAGDRRAYSVGSGNTGAASALAAKAGVNCG